MEQVDPFIYLCVLAGFFSVGICYLVFSLLIEGIRSINLMLKENDGVAEARKKKSDTRSQY